MVRFHKSVPVVLTSLGLVLVLTQLSHAQRGRGGFGRFLGDTSQLQLATLDQVQTELDLSDEHKKTVIELNEKLRAQRGELFQGGGDRAAAREKYTELSRELADKFVAMLNDKQQQRLQEIYLQVNGASVIGEGKIAEALAITPEQQAKLAEVREQRMQSIRDSFRDFQDLSGQERRERMAEWRRETDQQLLAVLTDEQRGKFEQMKGEKIEVDLSQLRRGRRNN